MTTTKTQEIAFQKLLKLVKDGSFDIYETSGDIYGSRSWEIDCFKPLQELKYSKTKTRQQALNETLMNLTQGDFPKTRKRMDKEQKVIHLTLLAGANPNYSECRCGSVFDSFWYSKKGYGLLELVQDNRFESPKELQGFYDSFHWIPLYCSASDEKILLAKQENKNREDLVYALFQKGMYPTNPKVFEKLSPIVLERDPEFFNKKKEQVVSQMKRAKTPLQIYNALMGKRKEKNS